MEKSFPGGLESQMDWKECLECENLKRTHTHRGYTYTHFLKLSPALCSGQIKVTGCLV